MPSKFREIPVETLKGVDRDTLLQAWQETSQELAELKIRETQLRLLAFFRMFPTPSEGVNTFELGNGFLFKALHKLNYAVKRAIEPEPGRKLILDNELLAIDKMIPGESDRLIKWSPDVSVGEFKKLKTANDKAFSRIEPFVTVTPGLPTLSILAPGDEGNKRT